MPEKTPAALAVPVDLAQALFAYLAARPWGEVNQMIAGLQACPPAPELPEVQGDA